MSTLGKGDACRFGRWVWANCGNPRCDAGFATGKYGNLMGEAVSDYSQIA